VDSTATRLAVDALATYRITRLVTTDDLFAKPRDELVDALVRTGHPKLAELVECPYCVSVWAALGVVFVAPRLPWWKPLRFALALAGLVAVLHDVEAAIRED